MIGQIADILLLTLVIIPAYAIGLLRGKYKQQKLWQDHMDTANRYIFAVDDLDRWCSHTSKHAKLIARHLKAQGKGEGCNSGTPVGDEACTVHGLREQLKRIDAAKQGGDHE